MFAMQRRLFVGAVFLLTPNLVFGQEQVLIRGFRPNTDGGQNPALIRQTRQKYLSELIDAMHTPCGLTKAQLSRLRVASKGAVEYSLKKTPKENAPVQLDDLVVLWEDNIVRHGQQSQEWAAADEPIWVKTLERMLTPAQLAAAKFLESEQRARFRKKHQHIDAFGLQGFDLPHVIPHIVNQPPPMVVMPKFEAILQPIKLNPADLKLLEVLR